MSDHGSLGAPEVLYDLVLQSSQPQSIAEPGEVMCSSEDVDGVCSNLSTDALGVGE